MGDLWQGLTGGSRVNERLERAAQPRTSEKFLNVIHDKVEQLVVALERAGD